MTKKLRDELFQVLKVENFHGFYDYIANNYWELSKDDLKNILLEVIAASETNLDDLTSELEDRFPAEDYEDEE